MPQPKIFVTRRINSQALERLGQFANVFVREEDFPPNEAELILAAQENQGLVTMLTDPITERVIEAGKDHLQLISQMAVGIDNIAIAKATEAGIPVGHTPGILTEATADHTWALLMAAARRIGEADRSVRKGFWQPWGPDVFCGVDIYGSTLGIIGFGRIGQAVAKRATGFGMKVVYYDQHSQKTKDRNISVSLDELLSISDFVSLHVYLSPATLHMIGKEQFKKMKPNAILVNTSRGSVVDPAALYWALKNQVIMAAGIDVYEPEPISPEDPNLKLENLVITPHIASATTETRKKMAMVVVENVIAGLEGKQLPYCANPDVYLLKSKKQN
jgi:glyoxylate reductase